MMIISSIKIVNNYSIKYMTSQLHVILPEEQEWKSQKDIKER
jgi:hypothetical protein